MQIEEFILNSYTFELFGTYIASFGNVQVTVVKRAEEFFFQIFKKIAKDEEMVLQYKGPYKQEYQIRSLVTDMVFSLSMTGRKECDFHFHVAH